MVLAIRALLGAALSSMLLVSAARSAESESAIVDQLVHRMAQTLNAAESFTVHAEKLFDVVLITGPRVQHEPQQTIFLSDWDLAATLPNDVFDPEINDGSVPATFLRANVEE